MLKKLSFALPFVVAIFSVVTLFSANSERVDLGQVVAPAIFSLIVAGLFLVLFWLFKWTSAEAPLVASVFTGFFLCWYIAPWPVNIALLGLTLFIVVLSRHNTSYGSEFRTGLPQLKRFLVIMLVVGIVVSSALAIPGQVSSADNSQGLESYVSKPGQPNIYFLVPDRMPSPAAMRESGIDPDQFVADLRGLGFYVKEDQASADPYLADMGGSFFVETSEVKIHTTRTMRYFASVLNGGVGIPLGISYQNCRTMIRDNAAFTWLHGKGYKIVNVASWFTETSRFPDADQNLTFEDVSPLERFYQNELGEAAISRSLLRGLNLRALQQRGYTDGIEIRRLQWQASRIQDQAAAGGSSTFVISHIMLPHEPFVFGDPSASIQDQYYANIRQAMTYLSDLAGELRAADPSAVIIIQSDEGMAFRKPIELNYKLSPVQWSGVFSAWFMPNYNQDLINIKHTDILGVVLEK